MLIGKVSRYGNKNEVYSVRLEDGRILQCIGLTQITQSNVLVYQNKNQWYCVGS
jgi:hypothetical protein